jgi:hypothetical protein
VERPAAAVVSEITTGDHSESAHGRECARFGAAEGVLVIAVPHQLALKAARQVDVPAERVANLAITFTNITVALGPAGIVVAVSAGLIGPLPVAGTTSERSRRLVIAVARSRSGAAPVVITIAVASAAAGSATRGAGVPVVIARIVVAGVEVKHGGTSLNQRASADSTASFRGRYFRCILSA